MARQPDPESKERTGDPCVGAGHIGGARSKPVEGDFVTTVDHMQVGNGNGTPAVAEPTAGELVARGVCAWFGSRLVLEDVNLDMERSRVTALIGPSGCGKSTFLRILNRMHEVIPGAQIAGRVELDGVDIYGGTLSPTQVRARIGMVFQKPNPFPAMSIGENVLAGLKLSGSTTPDRGQLIEEC